MASINPRTRADGSVAYRVMFRLDGDQTSVTFDTLEEADAFKEDAEKFGARAAVDRLTKRLAGTAAGRMLTVAEAVAEHIAKLTKIEPGTRSKYEMYQREHIAPTTLGGMPLDVPDGDAVGAWIDDLAEQYSKKYIENIHGVLSAAIARFVPKLREDNPAYGQKIPDSIVEEHVFLTHSEFAIFFSAFPTRWQPFVATLAGTGMRWSEATAMQVRDVRLDHDTPYLSVVRAWKWTGKMGEDGWKLGAPKSKKGRRNISLSPNVVQLLRPLIEGRKPTDLLFPNRAGNTMAHSTFYQKVWKPALARAMATKTKDGKDIPAAARLTRAPSPHDLRHSHASWLLADGVPIMDVQYRLGHESIKTTVDLYGHLIPGHQERAAASVDRALALALPELVEPRALEGAAASDEGDGPGLAAAG